MIVGGEQAELVHAPAVAELHDRIARRPHYLADQPLEVEAGLWSEAQEQFRDALKARGWPLPVDTRLLGQGVSHFMLRGVPIVMKDEA
jgi:hypothetical protein